MKRKLSGERRRYSLNLMLILRSELVSLIVLLLLLWYSSVHGFYDNSKKYTALNLLAIGHVVFDIITVITVNNQDKVSPLVNRICHEIFYMFAILFCYMLVYLVLEMTYGIERSKRISKPLAVLPAAYLIAMSFLPIEYVQGNGSWYSFGPCVFAGYACAAILFIISMVLVVINIKKISSHNRTTLVPAFIIMLLAMIVQIKWPELLFTGADVTLVTAGVFIGIVDPVGKFKNKAYFDHMTGLRNHNCYDDDIEMFRKELEKGSGISELIYVACDINGLKQINDDYGHAAGDDYIRHAARSLRESLTGSHAIYRTGGDEFCAIYIDKPEEQVSEEVARLRKTFGSGNADEGIRMVTDRPFSISIGYVTALSGEDIAETAARADAMMMEEKRKYYQMSGIDRRRSGR